MAPTYENESSSEEDYSSDEVVEPPPPPKIPAVVANYYLNENLGSGYSGSIFKATHLHTNQVVALKVQYVHHECPTNRYERVFFPMLQGGIGMPRLYGSGVQGVWDYLAMELLGPSLDSLFRRSGKEMMDLRSVCSIGVQLIQRLQFMHQRGLLHRDIQLGNCVIGLPPHDKTIYMIDFGFSKQYIDPRTGRHIPDSNMKRDFIGNYWFSSVGVHCRGKVPSRRDDMEAAALMLIHLLTPRGLTWTRNGVPKTDGAHKALKLEKRNATPEMLCRGLPSEFEEFLIYTRRLSFKECPNYDSWVQKFRGLAREEGFTDIDAFHWPPPPIKKAAVIKTFNTPIRATGRPVPRDEMAGILNGLTRLNLGVQPVLGDRVNVENVIRQARQDALRNPNKPEVITISSTGGPGGDGRDSHQAQPARALRAHPTNSGLPKAALLNALSNRASQAGDNKALAGLVKEFAEILQMNSSRTVTKEAFHFLDVLYKQLDDPSVFIQPHRTSRQQSFNEEVYTKDPAHVKLGVVSRLRREVTYTRSNKEMANMVAEFARTTNKSTGRTITKVLKGFFSVFSLFGADAYLYHRMDSFS
ncbi:kinase-like domain-containing protein [Panaeolus papilionaceus]|nr:kinase-like domain-containing protein [Panaeolus papilionaceus]